MLTSLWLDRFIRRYHQQQDVNSGRTGQHVADEALVPRHINETEANTSFFQKRKTQINRDPTPLFFFEAVRVRAGQRFDQRRLPVVDVSGRADNDAFEAGAHFSAKGCGSNDATGVLNLRSNWLQRMYAMEVGGIAFCQLDVFW
jgi:hypothetical protein